MLIIIVLLAFYEGDPNITDDGMVVWWYGVMVGWWVELKIDEEMKTWRSRNCGTEDELKVSKK